MSEAKITLTAEDRTKAAFESVKANLTGLHTKAVAVTGVLAGLGVTAWAANLIAGARATAEAWDELGKSAQRNGMDSAQSMAELEYAGKMAGLSVQGLETAVGKLSSKMADAAGGNKEALQLFDTLGVKVKGANGELRATDEVLADLADRFANWKDGPEKSALAAELFGDKVGRQLIPLLNGGRRGLEELRGEFRALHGQITDENVRSAEQFNDNLTRLQTASGALERELAAKLLPGLVQITDAMVEQAKEGNALLAIWAGLKEFGKISVNKDDFGTKIVQAQALGDQVKRIGDEMDRQQLILQRDPDNAAAKRRFDSLRKQLEEVSKEAAKASDLLKNVLNPTFDSGDGSYDILEGKRLPAKQAAPVNKKPPAGESEYAKLNRELEKRLQLEQAEFEWGGKLSEARKFEVDALAQITANTSKLSAAERERLTGKVQEVKASIEQNQLRDAEFKKALEEAQERQRIRNAEYEAGKALVQQEQELSHQRMKSAGDMLKQIEFETSLIGMNNQQRDVAIALRELEKQGIKEGTLAWETYAAAIQQAVAKRSAMQQQVDDFKEIWSSIDRTAHDVWTNVWEGGSNVFKRLGQTLKASLLDLLYQMTVKRWLINITANLTGASGNVAQAAAGSGNGLLGSLGNLVGMPGIGQMANPVLSMAGLGNFGGGLSAGISGLFGEAGLAGTLDAGFTAIGAGNLAGGLGTLAGPLGIALAVGSLIHKMTKGETRVGGQYLNTGFEQGPSGGQIAGATDAIASTMTGINESLRLLGSDARLSQLYSGLEQSERGKGFAFAGGVLSTGVTFGQDFSSGYMNRRGDKTAEQALKEFGEELKQATLEALQAANVDGILGAYLRSLGDAATLTAAEIDTALGRINKALGEKQTLEARLFDLTSTPLQKLVKARDAERAAIDESNRALLEQVYAQEDLQAALARGRDDLARAYENELSQLQSTTDSVGRFAERLGEFRDSLLTGALSPLTPGQRYAELASQYAIVKAQKDAGSLSALEKFPEVAQAFLEASQLYNASGAGYQNDFAMVLSDSEGLKSIAELQYDTAQQQLDALNAQVLGLVDVRTAVLSVRDAVAAIAGTRIGGNAGDTVRGLYAELFGRAPDQEGYDFWMNQLAQGQSVDQVRQAMKYSARVMGVPGFANGGVASGWAMVGERGPELVNFTAPARVYTAQQTAGMLGDNTALAAEVRALRASNERLQQQLITVVSAYARQDLQASGELRQAVSDTAARREWQARTQPVIA